MSENVSLQLTEALAQLQKLDKALAKSLRASIQLDTKLALEKIRSLRKVATETLGKKIDVNLSTVAARAELGKLETSINALRKIAEKNIQIGVNRQSIEAQTRAVDRLSLTVDGYRTSAASATSSTRLLTTALRQQAVQAGILAAELKSVVVSIEAINVATSKVKPVKLGPGRAELNEILREQKEFEKRIGRDINDATLGPINNGRILALQDEAKAAKVAAAEQRKLADEVERGNRRARAGLSALNAESRGLNQQLIATGRSLSILFTLPTVIAGAFAAFNEFKFQETIQRTKVLTDAFTKFDETGKKVNLTATETTTRIAGLRDVFNSIATKTGQTPNDIAAGFYFVASAGGVAATRLSILRVAAQGAAVGLGSVEVVADALTSVLNAYGEAEITAASAGDILVRAVNDAKVEADAFAPQLGRLLPIAAELGINFAQVAESLALITQTGNTAGVASTQLRGIFQSLIRPTSQKAADILAEVGLSVAQLKEQVSRPSPTAFIDTLLRLRQALPVEQFAQLFRRVDALNGALTLTNTPLRELREAFGGIDEAAKNVSGDLEEFERFAKENRALQIKQAFAQLLTQLQPLGQKVLPLVAKGIGGVVVVIDRLGDLLKVPILGGLALGLGAALVAAGPLIFSLGKIRQAIIALTKVQTVLGVSGGFSRFIKGEAVADIAAGANAATQRVGLLGKAFGALPGLIGVGAAAGLAFFSGTALASNDLKTRLLGVVGTLGSVTLAYRAAAGAARALGAAGALAGGIGIVAGLLVGGIAAWTAYKEATEKSHKALVEFQHSLEGLTANEAVQNFGASLTKSLEGITADDRVTRIEIPELRKALDDLGLSYEDLGQKLLDVVLANPDDLKAQQLALRGLGEEVGGLVSGNRLQSAVDLTGQLNAELKNLGGGQRGPARLFSSLDLEGALSNLIEMGKTTDEVRDAFVQLDNAGLISFTSTGISIKDTAAAAKILGDTLGGDATDALNKITEAFRRARQIALDTTGEFTTASNAAGDFKTVIEDGVETDTFVSNVDDAAVSLDSLTKALDDAVAAVFGIRDATTVSELADTLSQAAEKRAKDLIDLKKPADESFINFKVGLSGADGTDARQYIRDQIDGIDKVIAPFLSGPNANIDIALQIREQQVQTLAAQLGITVKQLNDFLATDRGGLTTAQIGVGLDKNSTQQVIDDLADLKSLIDSSPLTQEVKLQVEKDTTGALFGSELLAKGLSNGKIVVDFVVNAESSGTSLDQLQTIFAAAPQDTVRNIVINAIDQGVSIDKISQFLAAVPSTVRLGLKVEPPEFVGVGTDVSDLDKQRFLFKEDQKKQITINTAVTGADALDVERVADDATDQAQNRLDEGGGVVIPASIAPVDTSGIDDARDAALAASGEFIVATDAAGSFVTTLDESGSTFTTFRTDIDKTTATVSGLTQALDAAVQAVFGIRDQTTLSTASDALGQLATKRAEDLAAATEKTTKAQAQADVASAQQAAADARSAKAAGESEEAAAVEAAQIAKDAAAAEAEAAAIAARAAANPGDVTSKTPREVAAEAAVAAADLALQQAQAANDAADQTAREASANAAVVAADEAVRAAQAKATAAEAAGVNFRVGLEGPDATDARQFVRDQIDAIDAIIAPFLSGPEADIPVGLKMRDDAIADLATQTGLTLDQVNQFLASDRGGTSTIQVAAQLQAVQVDDIAKALADMQAIIDASPLTAEVKASVRSDTTGLLFGDQLLALGLSGDGSQLVDFIINLETVGTPLSQIQAIFAAADPTVVHDFIVNAINRGVPLDDISKTVAAIPAEIRTGLVVESPVDENGQPIDLVDFKVNAVLEGADDFARLQEDVTQGVDDVPIVTVVDDTEFQALIATIAEGANLQVLATVEPAAYNAMIKQIKDGLAALGITPSNGALKPRGVDINQAPSVSEAGNIFGGGGFRAFRAGGMVNGYGLRREPMFGKVRSNMRGILWGEPQTHKEAYIPYNPARRVRAVALVSRVARDFGMEVSRHRVAVARHGATFDGERFTGPSDGKQIAQLAGQVATLASVIEEREVRPLIGEYHAETKTTNPRATARYLASDILKAIR